MNKVRLSLCFLIMFSLALSVFAETRYAVLVGIDQYDPAYGASSLISCVNDANGTYTNVMINDPGERWAAANLQRLTNKSATRTAVRGALNTLATTAGAGDLVVYYHSSHGGRHSGTDTYLCTFNANYEDYELAEDLALFNSQTTVIVIIDACHSGGMFKGVPEPWQFAENVMRKFKEVKTKQLLKAGRALPRDLGANIAFMTAADYNQYSMSGLPYSLFAGYIITGCDQPSVDTNGDGEYQFYELFVYAKANASQQYSGQTAQYYNQTVLSSTVARSLESHEVSTPGTPSGTTTGDAGTTYTYSTTGSTCDQGHSVEYKFSWGDGSVSKWNSSTSATHSWSSDGTYSVRLMARCSQVTSITSSLSAALSVVIGEGSSSTGSTPVPVYRLYCGGGASPTYEHLFTVDQTETTVLSATDSWEYEGIAWYGYTNQVNDSLPLYRMYNSSIRQHLYTTNAVEYSNLSQAGTGWSPEDIRYYVYAEQVTGSIPVYRFYNSSHYLHHYTASEDERSGIVTHPEWGYEYEGVAFYVITSAVSQVRSSVVCDDHQPYVELDANATDREFAGVENESGSMMFPSSSRQSLIFVPADYDGDGVADPALYEESTGEWYVLGSAGESEISDVKSEIVPLARFGGPGLAAVPADYDGDGVADPALYEESTGDWYVLGSAGESEISDVKSEIVPLARFGGPGLAAVPADYDGDGFVDPAVCCDGKWFVSPR